MPARDEYPHAEVTQVYPLNDLKEHTLDGPGGCECEPYYIVVDKEDEDGQYAGKGLVEVHNSFDGREWKEGKGQYE